MGTRARTACKEEEMTQTVKVPQLAWAPRDLDLSFPDGWHVEVCHIAGHDRPALDDEQIRAAVMHPLGMPPLREFARGRKEAVIIFDDFTRVTRVSKIVPSIVDELSAAGIPDSSIRFIAALGNHGAMTRDQFAKKLGEATLARFPVYNHNPRDNCAYVGTTSRGTEARINAEVMYCDLKITVAACTPHPFAIFGAGGKMILPGVAAIESVQHNHHLPQGPDFDTNDTRLDMEEVARLVGLDMAVECIINLWGDTVALFAGAEPAAHAAAVAEARGHYLCPKARDKDIVIANTYAKASESAIGLRTGASLKEGGGSLVLIANTPEGQVTHYLIGTFGRTIGGREPIKFTLPPAVDRLIVFTEYPDIAGTSYLEPAEKVLQLSKWDDVVRTLREFHGDRAAVAVYPNADILRFG